MKWTFFSNYLNHHQLPFCLEMSRITGDNFYFVATKPISEKRISFGYRDLDREYPFVVRAYENSENMKYAMQLAIDSDVVIFGETPGEYVKLRMKYNKLSFRYSERIFREGVLKALLQNRVLPLYFHHTIYRNKQMYMLCASAYTAYDYSLVGAYKNKTFKWGYFPIIEEADIDALMSAKRKNEIVKLLWVGRLIELKHPEVAVELAYQLKQKKYNFVLEIIGNGIKEHEINEQIKEKGLEDCVRILGSMPPQDVREKMNGANIFLFTSDFKEGWGAVLNEAMNSACAVVASHAIGSVPYLIQDEENGFIYNNGDFESLLFRVIELIENPNLRELMGSNAYKTINNLWNAQVAAERLLVLSQSIYENKTTDLFLQGPCSRADILRNGWYNSRN